MTNDDPDSVVRRLLGPRDREVSCDECFEFLDAYVDCERDGRDADGVVPGLAAHLEGCPACREDYESLRALVVAAGDSAPAPPAA